MFQLKKISSESIPSAIEKAERYRLLNEPSHTESICTDILEIDPKNGKAIITLILAITDQFGSSAFDDLNRARQLTETLSDDYQKQYYSGIICERKGKSILQKSIPDGEFIAYEWLVEAMEFYEKAGAIRPTGNDDAILRWNTCARLIMKYNLKAKNEQYVEQPLE
ncbi:MAG TPA: hypothetical protein VEV87_03055 [Chitinophagaceae bacterium]|nr:hypothetical protein [Chitinophagaceae bacterium]